ncbi:hypothetical protein CR513_60644, partial [Mucuna pruriens]
MESFIMISNSTTSFYFLHLRKIYSLTMGTRSRTSEVKMGNSSNPTRAYRSPTWRRADSDVAILPDMLQV